MSSTPATGASLSAAPVAISPAQGLAPSDVASEVVAPAGSAPVAASSGNSLPTTGADIASALLFALALVAVGALMTALRKRPVA